jgi:hypothetical protein
MGAENMASEITDFRECVRSAENKKKFAVLTCFNVRRPATKGRYLANAAEKRINKTGLTK